MSQKPQRTHHAGREALIAEALLTRPSSSYPRDDWWRGAMFYEIYLRSFKDSNGDGIGDLPGVIERIDYLASLGVDGIWLSPIYPSPQQDFGYDITDLCGVDPIHGRLDDVKTLIRYCHERGIRLLLDFVPCHTSTEHPWFRQSRSSQDNDRADWYVWADAAEDGGPPNNWLSSFGGFSAWTWAPSRQQYYFHPFLRCQPALNLRNPATLAAVTDAMRFWLDLGVDGFRLDAVQCLCFDPQLRNNPPRYEGDDRIRFGGGPANPFARQMHFFDRDHPDAVAVIERLRAAVNSYDPPRALIGELADVDSSRFAVKYTVEGERLHAVYDFDLINANQTFEQWREQLGIRSEYIGSGWLMNCFTNHDSIRAVSNLTAFAVKAGKRAQGAKLLLFLHATLLGGGIIFQGEELGLAQPDVAFEDLQDPWAINLWPEFKGRDGVRTPIPWETDTPNLGFSEGSPWLRCVEEYADCAVDLQEQDEESVLNFFRALMTWRRELPVLRVGAERLVPTNASPLVVYEREDDDRHLVMALNFSLDEQVLPLKPHLSVLADVPGAGGSIRDGSLVMEGLAFTVLERHRENDS